MPVGSFAFVVVAIGALFALTICKQLHRYFTRVAPRYDEEVLDKVLQVIGTKPVPLHNQHQIFVIDVNASNDRNPLRSQVSTPSDLSESEHHDSPPEYELPPGYDNYIDEAVRSPSQHTF